MNKVIPISWNSFKSKFNIKESPYEMNDFVTSNDYLEIKQKENDESKIRRIQRFVSYIPFAAIHPRFIVRFIFPNIINLLAVNDSANDMQIQRRDFFKIHNMRASIVRSFKPKRILEIGTYLGVGAASFKMACPDAEVSTINPKLNTKANNPVSQNYIGYYYRKKNLKVKQIWSDSTKFDFKKYGKVDAIYIDGNHDFDFVYSDLTNSSSVVTRLVLLDDYIPLDNKKLVIGPWTRDVVRAVDTFLAYHPNIFQYAYWIKNTQLCVLIK